MFTIKEKCMENPIIEIKKIKAEKQLDYFTSVFIFLYWFAVFYRYNHISDVIPIHYDIDGSIGSYGDKIFIFISPFFATIIYLCLIFGAKRPHKFHYNVTITKENAERQYRNALQMIRVLNLGIVFSFFIIDIPILFTQDGIFKELNGFLFILIGIVPIFIIAYFTSKSYKIN